MCNSFCAEGTTLLAEAPERVRQQRDQTERDASVGNGGGNYTKKHDTVTRKMEIEEEAE